ncbi:MAG TPA: PEP-CTERM system TPR-repeat protein PrsT, partial [Gammaproteobacteria bacterium]|nr:PEP-CTERM system TPR-repeat protein PrsT [Gammaproteobacteria bacterium]
MDGCMNKFLLIILLFSGTGLLYGCSSDDTDAQYLANAQEYFDAGKMNAAAIELKNVLKENPDNPRARLLLGKLHIETGDLAAAEKELTKARKLGVEDELILPLLSRVLQLQGKNAELLRLPLENLTAKGKAEILAVQGQAKLAQGEVAEAASIIEQAISNDPGSANALIASARVHAAKKEFALAREKLEAAFLIDQKSASAWSMLGDIEWQEQNPDLAEKAYSKAIEFRKNSFADYFKRALVRIQLNIYDEAQQDVDSIKKNYPQHAGANYAQGLIFYHNKNFRDAAASFEVALSDEGRFPLALLYLGASYFLQDNPEQAETYAKRFVYLRPDNIDGRRLLAMIMYKKQEYSEAEELIRPVTEARKDDINALNILTGSLIKQNKMDEVIDLLARLAVLQPDSPLAQTRLGAGLLAEGKNESGVEHLESAIQLKPDNQQANALLILSY